MTAEFSGKRFGWQVARRGGLFVLLMVVVPLALFAADLIDDPDSSVSLTEAMRLTTGTFVGLLVYFLFMISMIRPCWRRVSALHLPGFSGLIVVLLLLAEFPYFSATNPDSVFGRSISTLDGQFPFYFAAAMGVVVAMIVARPPTPDDGHSRYLGIAGKSALVLAVLILSIVAFNFGMAKWMRVVVATLSQGDAPSRLFLDLAKNSYWLYVLNPYLCALFIALITWTAVLSRRRPKASNE